MSGLAGLLTHYLTGYAAAETAHQLALVPLAVALVISMRGRHRDEGWWWIVAGMSVVPWTAGTASHYLPESWSWVPSLVYPAPQAALVARVFLRRAEAFVFLVLLAVGASVASVLHAAHGPDYLFRAFAWFGILGAAVMANAQRRLLVTLAIYFGLGWLAWLVHALRLDLPTWYVYQGVQFVGLVLLSWAMWTARAPLRLVR